MVKYLDYNGLNNEIYSFDTILQYSILGIDFICCFVSVFYNSRVDGVVLYHDVGNKGQFTC